MDIKQGCLTFRTKFSESYFTKCMKFGAAPIFERGSLSQYLILICHIKASVCHIRLHPWKLLAFTWQQAPWIIALNMESLLLLRRKRISCVDIFKTRAKKLLLHFPRRWALGRHFQQWRKAMVATSRHFPQWRKLKSYGCYFSEFPTVEESYFQTCSCTLSQDMLLLPSTVSTCNGFATTRVGMLDPF